MASSHRARARLAPGRSGTAPAAPRGGRDRRSTVSASCSAISATSGSSSAWRAIRSIAACTVVAARSRRRSPWPRARRSAASTPSSPSSTPAREQRAARGRAARLLDLLDPRLDRRRPTASSGACTPTNGGSSRELRGQREDARERRIGQQPRVLARGHPPREQMQLQPRLDGPLVRVPPFRGAARHARFSRLRDSSSSARDIPISCSSNTSSAASGSGSDSARAPRPATRRTPRARSRARTSSRRRFGLDRWLRWGRCGRRLVGSAARAPALAYPAASLIKRLGLVPLRRRRGFRPARSRRRSSSMSGSTGRFSSGWTLSVLSSAAGSTRRQARPAAAPPRVLGVLGSLRAASTRGRLDGTAIGSSSDDTVGLGSSTTSASRIGSGSGSTMSGSRIFSGSRMTGRCPRRRSEPGGGAGGLADVARGGELGDQLKGERRLVGSDQVRRPAVDGEGGAVGLSKRATAARSSPRGGQLHGDPAVEARDQVAGLGGVDRAGSSATRIRASSSPAVRRSASAPSGSA